MEEKERIQEVFGQVLYELRMAKNFKQAELAEKSRLDETYVSDLERGNHMPSLYTLLKLAQGLDVPVSKFLSGFEDKIS